MLKLLNLIFLNAIFPKNWNRKPVTIMSIIMLESRRYMAKACVYLTNAISGNDIDGFCEFSELCGAVKL